MSKNFLLGLGCQRGGTTWLHDYLSHNDAVNLGVEKEYHVFDALSIASCRHYLHRTSKARLVKPWNKWLHTKMSFYNNPENYFDYFNELYHSDKKNNLVGDITPSYAGLNEKVLTEIKQGVQSRGFKVKVVFFMREPFQRVFSHMKMLRMTNSKRLNTVNLIKLNEAQHLLHIYKENEVQMRTRYEDTIQKIENVFDDNEVIYCFYEELFELETIERLINFLEIPFKEPNFNEKIHSTSDVSIDDATVFSEVAEFYRDTYEYVEKKFGCDFVSRKWSATHQILNL